MVNFQYLQLPPIPLPDPSKKRKYDSINVTAIDKLFSGTGRSILGSKPIEGSDKLLTFEELDQFSGFVLYETMLPNAFERDPSNLVVEKLRDRALVYVDQRLAGVLSRENAVKSLPITKGNAGKKLQIFVENQGRINFQENFDFKGILGNVTIQAFEAPYYSEISDWTITGYDFDDYGKVEELMKSVQNCDCKIAKNHFLKESPMIFKGTLTIDQDEELADTWWNYKNWGKGFMFVNGHNLGRYWSVGPQMTLYIAKEFLKRGENTLVVVELQKVPADLNIEFTDAADYNEN